MTSLLAFALAACAALAWYAASPHGLWSIRRVRPRVMRGVGSGLALLSLWVWIAAYGLAVGLCAMLASVMLALIGLPYLALFMGGGDATEQD